MRVRGQSVAGVFVLLFATIHVPEPHLRARGAASLVPVNIAWVLTDDVDVPMFNDAAAHGFLPNIQSRILTPGMVADAFYVAISQCCPARATMLTGQYAQNNHVLANEPPNGGVARLDEAHVLPCWLRATGYQTMHVGKYLNGYGLSGAVQPPSNPYSSLHVPPCWTVWQGLVDPAGYTDYDHEWSVSVNGGAAALFDDRPFGRIALNYLADMLTLRTIYGLAALMRSSTAPWFIEATPTTPHYHVTSRDTPYELMNVCPGPPNTAPGTAGGNLWGITAGSPARYAGTVHLPLPMAPSFNESDATLANKPAPINTAPVLTAADIACAQLVYQRRIEQLRAVDDMVGEIFYLLDQTGQTPRTVVCIGSDNGYLLGDHRLIEKLWGYERSIHVPFACVGPGFPAHHTSTMLTDADIAATFADLAGATPTLTMDGRSFLKELQGAGRVARNVMPLMAVDSSIDGPPGFNLGGYLIPASPFYGVRVVNPPRKYIHYTNGATELYHLDVDPDELNNLAHQASASELAQLEAIAQTLATCSGAACGTAEAAFRLTP